MNDYDQERFSEVCEELDAAKERIKCLEADVKSLTAQPEQAQRALNSAFASGFCPPQEQCRV
jgi:hypothetical protein